MLGRVDICLVGPKTGPGAWEVTYANIDRMVGRKVMTEARIGGIKEGVFQYKSTRVKGRHVISGDHNQIPKMQTQPAIYNLKETINK